MPLKLKTVPTKQMDTSLEAAAKAGHTGTHAHRPPTNSELWGRQPAPQGAICSDSRLPKKAAPFPTPGQGGAVGLSGFTRPCSGSSSPTEADLGNSGSRGKVDSKY